MNSCINNYLILTTITRAAAIITVTLTVNSHQLTNFITTIVTQRCNKQSCTATVIVMVIVTVQSQL